MPYEDGTFSMVVLDPPHVIRRSPLEEPTGYQHIKYGWLNGDWREIIRRGFDECFRVLKTGGFLIFKWNETDIKVSEILKLIQICDDGTIFLVTSDEERPIPWEEDIKNVDALEITRELLEGFGFEVIQSKYKEDEFNVLYDGRRICGFYEYNNCNKIETAWSSYEYFHKFMDYIYYVLPKTFKLEWKGVEK